jgi:alkylation response protein AidB-like acyl-CoA dehydrogenase
MYFSVTDEQEMLRDAARSYLADRVPLGRVRELMETGDGFDAGLWKEMAGMGWQAMAVPESYGGAGFSYLELGILAEEMGRMLTPVPFLSSIVLGANAVLIGGSDDQRREYLPDVAAGERRVAVAVTEPGGGWSLDAIETTVRGEGDAVKLTGTKSYVLDGHTADLLVVAATSEYGTVDLFLVAGDAEGVTREPLDTMDLTRKQGEIRFDDAAAVARLGAPGSGRESIERLYDLAAVMLAFEQVGGAQRCLEMSVAYAKERVQFGRPIGSFQAIKHKCADMLVEVEAARSTAQYAGWALSTEDEDLPVAAALAKARCSDAYLAVASETIQVHGGIGFTWEHDAHLYFKRAKTDQLLFGDPAEWRAKLADRIGL